MRRRRRAVAAACLAVAVLVPSSGMPAEAQVADVVITGVCDQALRVERDGNTLDITTIASFCVTNDGIVWLDLEATVTAIVGWTCAGGVAGGPATVTIEHSGGTFEAGNILFRVADIGGGVELAMALSAGGKDVVGSGTMVELFNGPLGCVFNVDTFIWRGAIPFSVSERS